MTILDSSFLEEVGSLIKTLCCVPNEETSSGALVTAARFILRKTINKRI
jgi:hypothetical protein